MRRHLSVSELGREERFRLALGAELARAEAEEDAEIYNPDLLIPVGDAGLRTPLRGGTHRDELNHIIAGAEGAASTASVVLAEGLAEVLRETGWG
jgi:hypothetical protein